MDGEVEEGESRKLVLEEDRWEECLRTRTFLGLVGDMSRGSEKRERQRRWGGRKGRATWDKGRGEGEADGDGKRGGAARSVDS